MKEEIHSLLKDQYTKFRKWPKLKINKYILVKGVTDLTSYKSLLNKETNPYLLPPFKLIS
jgi:hypothetical protein